MAESQDIKYFNALFVNDTNAYKPAVSSNQMSQFVLDHAGEYYGSIIRFDIPASYIPIMSFDLKDEKSSSTEGIYGIGLTYDDGTLTQIAVNLEWVPTTTTAATISGRRWIYDYTDMMDMINTALQTAYDDLKGTYDPGVAPWFEYDPTTELFTLYTNENYVDGIATHPVKIWFNVYLYQLFQNLRWLSNIKPNVPSSAFNQDYQLILKSTGNNFVANKKNPAGSTIANCYFARQPYNALYTWNTFKTLQIVSYNMPVTSEVSPLEQDDGTFATSPILQDYQLPSVLGPDARSVIQYAAAGPWRWFVLNGNDPLNRINFAINFTDQYGTVYPLFLVPGTSGALKMAFVRKKLWKPTIGYEN